MSIGRRFTRMNTDKIKKISAPISVDLPAGRQVRGYFFSKSIKMAKSTFTM